MSHNGGLRRTTNKSAYGIDLVGPPSPKAITPVYVTHSGGTWPSPRTLFVNKPGGLQRDLNRRRKPPMHLTSSDSSLHLSARVHRAMGLERELARSPTGESPNVDDGPSFRRQDSSAHVGDEGLRASTEHVNGHSSGSGADDSNDVVSTSTRPSLPLRARTFDESGTGEQSDGDDDDPDSGSDDGLIMSVRRRPQPPQRAATEPASSAIQRFVPMGRQGRPAPLALKHTPYLPKDGPRSPPTTWRNPALAHGAIASPVDEESRGRRRDSFDAALSPTHKPRSGWLRR